LFHFINAWLLAKLPPDDAVPKTHPVIHPRYESKQNIPCSNGIHMCCLPTDRLQVQALSSKINLMMRHSASLQPHKPVHITVFKCSKYWPAYTET